MKAKQLEREHDVPLSHMTLRDVFAAATLAGMVANPEINLSDPQLAVEAYNTADAMLARRMKA